MDAEQKDDLMKALVLSLATVFSFGAQAANTLNCSEQGSHLPVGKVYLTPSSSQASVDSNGLQMPGSYQVTDIGHCPSRLCGQKAIEIQAKVVGWYSVVQAEIHLKGTGVYFGTWTLHDSKSPQAKTVSIYCHHV
jgi:hypothetical protein